MWGTVAVVRRDVAFSTDPVRQKRRGGTRLWDALVAASAAAAAPASSGLKTKSWARAKVLGMKRFRGPPMAACAPAV